MSRVQYIRNSQGEPVYAVLPIEEYHALLARQIACDDKTDEDLIELDYEQADNDSVAIPFDVVKIKHTHNVNLLGAWRIYRNLSQQEVADKLGLSQGAISQMERRDNKPQKKTLARFSQIYDCKIEQMYWSSNPPTIKPLSADDGFYFYGKIRNTIWNIDKAGGTREVNKGMEQNWYK